MFDGYEGGFFPSGELEDVGHRDRSYPGEHANPDTDAPEGVCGENNGCGVTRSVGVSIYVR